jgi:hypothetical protein
MTPLSATAIRLCGSSLSHFTPALPPLSVKFYTTPWMKTAFDWREVHLELEP